MKSISQSSHGCQVQMGSTKSGHLQPLRTDFKLIFSKTTSGRFAGFISKIRPRPHNRSVDWAVRGSLIATSYINSELCHSELY